MARIRTIKPEFWTSEQVMDCKPLTRLLFIGLWNFVDDYGRAPVAPRTIKAQVMPGDEITGQQIQTMLQELSSAGLILFYAVDGKEYFEITGWSKHQKIDNPSKYKVCPAPFTDQSPIVAIPSEESQSIGLEGKGREGNRTESIAAKVAGPKPSQAKGDKKARREPQTPLPDGFLLADEIRAYADNLNFSGSELQREHQRFCNHAKQNDRRCVDWIAAERNWFSKAAEFAGKQPKVSASDQPLSGVLVKFGTEAWDAWQAHLKQSTGKGSPRSPRDDGWYFDSEYPPGYERRKIVGATITPQIRSMQ